MFRKLMTERSLRKKHVYYRTTEPARVAEAYRSMSEDEFDSINAPQEWQNCRLIPRVIQSLRLTAPIFAVDLGCGSGQSTQVLGSHLPAGSMLFGYDICNRLLARARRRTYRNILGGPLKAHFINQSIAQPLHDPEGRRLAAGSVGLVNAAGVIGHHLSEMDVDAIAAEIAHVLEPSGSAVLDAGPVMPRPRLEEILAAHGFALCDMLRAVPCVSHPVLVFQRQFILNVA